MRRLILAMIIAWHMVAVTSVLATQRYVATTGSDSANNCTNSGSPCLTIARCINQMSASDTCNLADGVYAEGNLTPPSGSSNNPTIIKSTTPLGAVVRPNNPGVIDSIWLISNSQSWITWDGVDLDGSDGSGGKATLFPIATQNSGSSNLTLKNSRVHHSVGSCILIEGTSWTIERNEIDHCGTDFGGTGSDDHGLYSKTNDSLVQDNYFHDNAEYNMQQYPSGNNLTVLRNRFTGSHGGVTLTYGTGHLFANNLMWDDATGGNPNDSGLLIGNSPMTVLNNTLYNNSIVCINTPGGGDHSSNVFRNNITYGGSAAIVNCSSVTVSNNQTSDPSFANAPTDLRLTRNSTAIDAGTDTSGTIDTDYDGNYRKLPYPGGSVDRGAFEYDDCN